MKIIRVAEEGGYESDDYFRAYCTRGEKPDHNTEDSPLYIEKSEYDRMVAKVKLAIDYVRDRDCVCTSQYECARCRMIEELKK